MKIILKEDDAAQEFLEELIEKAVDRTTLRLRRLLDESRQGAKTDDSEVWVTTHEAKEILGIKGKKKMQQLRDESPMNGILLSKTGRTYLYNKQSLFQFLQNNIIR